jgi:ribose/xylose/arabinose/galactoside ABC-type transport system permease subunit
MLDPAGQIILLRTFSIMLYLIALGMIGARIFGGIDMSQVVPLSLMTIATANMVIAQTLSNKQNKPD